MYDPTHTKQNNHVKYCLQACRTCTTPSMQTGIIMLSIAYKPVAPARLKTTNTNNHVKYCLQACRTCTTQTYKHE